MVEHEIIGMVEDRTEPRLAWELVKTDEGITLSCMDEDGDEYDIITITKEGTIKAHKDVPKKIGLEVDHFGRVSIDFEV